MDDLTCIHQKIGLCPSCLDDFEEDESAWHEFGEHPAGLANWEALQAELAADAACAAAQDRTPPEAWDGIPF